MSAPSFQAPILSMPSFGCRVLPLELDFTNLATLQKQIGEEILQVAELDFVQSLYVDNSENADPIVFIFRGVLTAGYRISFPANAQGWMPVIIPKGIVDFSVSTGIGTVVDIQFGNFPVAPVIWPSATIANVTATIAPINGAYTDRGQVLTGGINVIMAVNANRKAFYLQSSVNNANPMLVQFVGGGQYQLLPGQQIDTNFVVTTQAINVTGTAGDILYAGEI